METMEEEPRHFSDVDSSVHLEDAPVTTETVSEVQNQNTEPRSELESAPSAVTPVTEKEGVVDVEVAVGGEEGGEDLIVGEEKDGMLDSGVEMKDSPPVDGDKEGGDGEDSHVEGERAEFVEDATVDDVMDEMEDAGDVSDERLTAEGIEVPAARQQVVELAQEAGNSVEQKVTDDVNDNLDVPEDKDVADVAEERGTDDATEKNLVKEETSVAVEVTDSTEQSVIKEETGIMEEREVAGLSVKSELPVDNEVEQSGEIKDKTGVDNIAEKIEYLDKPVVDLAVPTEVAGETAIDMVEKVVTLEEKMVNNVSEQTENLEDMHAIEEAGADTVEAEEDPAMEEESDNEEDTCLGNVAEDVDKAEGTETEMTDTAEVMRAADYSELPDMTEELETEAAEEMEGMEEIEDTSKASVGKRKRGKNLSAKVQAKAPSRKKAEEDVCFICFDGGALVLCDRRGCPKAYHPACVGRDEAFFQTKGKWNCGWHLCSNCKKNAHYMCYTCTFSLCKGCIKDAVILCVRGNKGFCESCMNLVMLIERKDQVNEEITQIDFDDRGSWEYLFKDYWTDLKERLSITLDELSQAKNPWKGAAKQESHDELHGFDDAGGSDSDNSSGNLEVTVSKRRKTRSQSKARAKGGDSPSTLAASGEGASIDENAEWASKELLEVVMNMRNGDKSVLSRMELSQLILDYIHKYKLRDRRNKSYVICDTRLKNLFGKPRVGHIEMLNLLEPHIFFTKEDSQTDDFQGSVVDAEANQLEADWNSDALTKTGKDKKRKNRKKGDARGLQSNVDDYAAIDMHNINLIYLRRNLAEELLEDTETFHDKVVDSFVRIRISGTGQKQDLYRLVQVVGTSKVAEQYRVGKRTTDFLLEILNLNKTEAVSIDIISNQEFTEDECKRLRQSIKCGLINRLTVGDIQEKAMTIQEVRVKDWLESEITRLSHLRDRASDLGRRKELRECVEKLQVLKTPEELQRRLEEFPEIHADPNMDPSYESEEEEDDKKQENYLRPRGSGFSRRGKELISPRKGGYSSNDSWSGNRNYSSMNRELSRSLSSKGFTSKGDDSIVASEMGNENSWSLAREREIQQPNSWSKPKTALNSEIGTRNAHNVVIQEPSLKVVSESSPARPYAGVATGVQINESEKMWHYQDPSGKFQGPFSIVQLRKWSNTGYFPADLKIWRTNEAQDDSILLTDALAGKFQKDPPPVVDNSLPKAQMALYGNSLGATLKQGMESQVGERSRLDQHHVAWSPQRVLASPGQSVVESWKSQTEIISSTVRPSPSSLEIPKHSRDTWASDTNLPSPTPNQTPSGGNRGQAFESKWSPTPAQPSGSLPVPNPFQGGPVGLQPATVLPESGSPAAPVVHSHTMVSSESHRRQVNDQASVNLAADIKNAASSIQNLVQSMSAHNPSAETHGPGSVSVSRHEAISASSVLATGNQRWANASTQKLEPNPSLAMPAQTAAYGHWSDASQSSQIPAPFNPGNPTGGFPTPGQQSMMPLDSWRPAGPIQSNVQLPAPHNLPWGMTVADNQGTALRQAPGNQNPAWGPMPGNQNMGWGAPAPSNTNMNWGAPGQGSTSVNPNQNWAAPGQRQVPGNVNPGWTGPGNTMQGWTPPGQGPNIVNNANSGWVAPAQGAAPGIANPGYPAPSRNTGGMWGNEPSYNGDKFSDQRDRSSQGGESGFGGAKPWSRQSSFGGGGGSSRSSSKGQRVCKFHENGHCKKGASCDYMHT
ncbi:zinc finger CCCH domain-containing protein 19-like isoform X1 [Hibiscus syriacus]|uniref:zinc finger CCCH domain-containing protein 19-like isoform X1 n=2 Tax=Hibiscus syriacus TaxID=106335 RepID=UPI001922BA2D|nr:zinc finger CCCH domain-containing protein 19-like isoform X1 [Hibiscus syriacus]